MLSVNQIAEFLKMQYLNVVSDEVNFLHVNRHQNFLQVDTIVLEWLARHASSNCNSTFAISS